MSESYEVGQPPAHGQALSEPGTTDIYGTLVRLDLNRYKRCGIDNPATPAREFDGSASGSGSRPLQPFISIVSPSLRRFQ
jgi:hypothetical protein